MRPPPDRPDRPDRPARRPATDAEARALASTLRLRILRSCLGEAQTNKEIAGILGRDPASVLHHVRTLVDTGFLAAQPSRRGVRGSREIPYLATGKSWLLDSPGVGPTMLSTFAEEVALVPAEQVRITRIGLRLDEAQRDELDDRIAALLEEYADRPPAPGATAWSAFWSLHPDPNRIGPGPGLPASS